MLVYAIEHEELKLIQRKILHKISNSSLQNLYRIVLKRETRQKDCVIVRKPNGFRKKKEKVVKTKHPGPHPCDENTSV